MLPSNLENKSGLSVHHDKRKKLSNIIYTID